MKKHYTLKLCLFVLITLNAISSGFSQGVGINATGAPPNPKAGLDVDFTDKGVLIPRLTLQQRDAISTPPNGLIIYNVECNNFNYFEGGKWIAVNTNDGYLPVTPGVISGETSICYGTTAVTYSIDAVAGAIYYRWSVPSGSVITSGQGTTSITVNFGNKPGNISVTETNACGTSGASSLEVSLRGTPAKPGPISGLTNAVPGQAATVTYSIASVYTAETYNWTLPTGASILSGAGSNSIIVGYGCSAVSGNISVTSENECGTSAAKTLAITLTNTLAAPGPITGYNNAVPGQAALVSYSVAPVSGASSYNWTMPTGASIVSGSGTTDVIVKYSCNAYSSNLSVTAQYTCAASAASTLAITVYHLVVDAGNGKPAGGRIGGSPTASLGQYPYSYSWNPTNDLNNSGESNPQVSCIPTYTTYNVTVTDANGCTGSNSATVTLMSGTAGGTLQRPACGGVTLGGSPTVQGGSMPYTYQWNAPAGTYGATTISSTSAANPSAYPLFNTVYTLTVTDVNNCSITSSVTVNVNAINGSATYNTYRGYEETFTVPAGVTCLQIEAWGSQGQSTNQAGGLGGYARGTISTTEGTVFYVRVGGQNTWNGGGGNGGGQLAGGNGGDGTDVRTVSNGGYETRIIVAGGGGGAGGYSNGAFASGTGVSGGASSSGGPGGTCPSSSWGSSGGGGGGAKSGADGGTGCWQNGQGITVFGYGGSGNALGGNPGNGGGAWSSSNAANGSTGNPGSLGAGGGGGGAPQNGCIGATSGGGGGGGYYGGGGGGGGGGRITNSSNCHGNNGGGGGGGSNYTYTLSNGTFSDGVRSGTGQVVFTW